MRSTTLFEDLPCKEVSTIEDYKCCLAFDDSSTPQGVGMSRLYAPDGTDVSISFKLKFPCANNEAEYEALFIELVSTLQMGIRRLYVQRTFRLVIKEVNEELGLKWIALVAYQNIFQSLIKYFSSIQSNMYLELTQAY